jgi:hypothetical protein
MTGQAWLDANKSWDPGRGYNIVRWAYRDYDSDRNTQVRVVARAARVEAKVKARVEAKARAEAETRARVEAKASQALILAKARARNH